jgi:hypothetical protein
VDVLIPKNAIKYRYEVHSFPYKFRERSRNAVDYIIDSRPPTLNLSLRIAAPSTNEVYIRFFVLPSSNMAA